MRHRNESTIDFETLGCIAKFQRENGHPPTYEELAVCLGLKGKSSVQRRLDRLIVQGAIEFEGWTGGRRNDRTVRIVTKEKT
jgi:SOS-response transcriptional repressor LexA